MAYFRYCDDKLDMTKTMEGNGILDDRDICLELGLQQNLYVPGVLLYFNDDLKWEEQEMLKSEAIATEEKPAFG